MASSSIVVLAAVGACYIAIFIAKALYFAYATFVRAPKNLKKFGKWAVVTGASDGIGKAYVNELAKKGLNIVLISRTESKLMNLSVEIEQKYKVQTKVIPIDFNVPDNTQNFNKIKSGIAGLEVGVLINNVGVSYDYPEFFHEISDELIQKLINLNIVVLTEMTRIVLPQMIERKAGAIVNLSSGSGIVPVPLLTVYSATKAYVDFFSQGLDTEYKKSNIHVQSVTPFMVSTALSKVRISLTAPSPATFARYAVRQIGYESSVNPYWVHALTGFVLKSLPRSFTLQKMYDMHADIRKRALRKKAATAIGTSGKSQ